MFWKWLVFSLTGVYRPNRDDDDDDFLGAVHVH